MPLKNLTISRVKNVNHKRNAIILLAFLFLSSIFAVKILAQASGNSTALPNAINVTSDVITVTEMYNRSRSFTGRATAKRRSNLGFEMMGTLKEIHADDGDTFNKGDILARLDTSRLDAKLRELNARQLELEASQNLLQSTYDRVKKTNKKGHSSAQTLDEAYSKLVAGNARLQAHEAAISSIKIDLEKSEIKAPFNGTVTARLLDEGTIVSGGISVFDVIESGALEAKIGVSPAIAKQMNAQTRFELKNSLRKPIEGTFKNTISSIRGQTRTMLATFDIEQGASDGEIVTLVINDPIYISGAWVPIRALSSDVRGLWRLYKIKNGKNGPEIHFENVQLLHTSGDLAYVSGSFNDGDRIVSEGVGKLAKGQRVSPVSHKQIIQ